MRMVIDEQMRTTSLLESTRIMGERRACHFYHETFLRAAARDRWEPLFCTRFRRSVSLKPEMGIHRITGDDPRDGFPPRREQLSTAADP